MRSIAKLKRVQAANAHPAALAIDKRPKKTAPG